MHPLFNSTILRFFDGEIPCKPFICVLYYKRCKKTRMQIPAMVPKPRNGRSRREEKAYGSKKPNGGKKHECYFNEAVT